MDEEKEKFEHWQTGSAESLKDILMMFLKHFLMLNTDVKEETET